MYWYKVAHQNNDIVYKSKSCNVKLHATGTDWFDTQFCLCTGKILVIVLFRFKGLRDDLLCIPDEDLSSMCLCALHCEMRNTEQLLKSVGLLAYEIGSLKQCNEELSKFGPENFHSDRITVKLKPGQQTAPGRNNVSVSSFSGNFDIPFCFQL